MSYDLGLCDPVSGEVLELDAPHRMRGGTYAIGWTSHAELNVTYNYSTHFHRVLGEGGIRSLYGQTGAATLPMLRAAAAQLDTNVSDDYWEPTEGNARRALLQLAALAELRPDGVWRGD
jgi:hypothetical protein